MQNKPGWFTGLGACLLALFACGGEAEELKVDLDPAEMEVRSDEPARVLLVFAVHGLERGEVDASIAPNLVKLRKQGAIFSEHIIQSTGGQSEACTLLTGRSPLQHGVGSIHESGLSALAESEVTLAEFLNDKGFATLASMALPQFSPEISGLHHGFDTYLGPHVLGDSLRRSDRVEMVLRDDLASALGGDEPVFAWIQISDGLRPGLEPSANVMRFVKARLTDMLPQNPALQQSVELVDRSPEKFEEVRRSILRARGSAVHMAFMRGVYQGQLADLDGVVGLTMEALESSGRAQEAVIALVATQGANLGAKPNQSASIFQSDVLRAPLWLWSPGRIAPGTDTRLLSSHYVADLLCDLLGLQFGDQNPWDSVVSLWDAGMTRRAVVGTQFHLEENAAAGWLGFDDAGNSVMKTQGLSEIHLTQWNELQAAAAVDTVRFGYELNFDCAGPVTVRWRMVDGRSRGARVEPSEAGELGRVTSMTGSAVLLGQGALRLETYARETPVVWTLEGLPAETSALNQAALQVIRKPYGVERTKAEAESQAEVHRDAGIWTRVIVQGAANRPVNIFAGLVPKKQNATRRPIKMEWTVGFNDEVERLAGREDAVLLTGKTPLNVQFKEIPGHTLSLSIQVEDHWLSPLEMSYEGKFLAPAGQRTIYTPDWWPGVTEALFEESGLSLGPGLSLRRFGPLPKSRKVLSPDSGFFVSRLGRGQ
jgi:hypothetical protein